MSTQSRIDAEARKDPETLEREIDQKRADIGHLVDALESKLSPGQLIDQALAYAKGNGGEFFGNLGTTLKANPVPTVLTSVGLVWLMLGQNRSPVPHRHGPSLGARLDGAGQRLQGAGQRLQGARYQLGEQVDALQERASRAGHDLADGLSHTGERLNARLHDAGDRLQQQSTQLKNNVQHLLEEQPLALAAVGVALGAVIGAALPSTRTEDRLLGATSDRLTGKARQMASGGLEKARAMGGELLDEVKGAASTHRAGPRPGSAPSVAPGDNLSGEMGRL